MPVYSGSDSLDHMRHGGDHYQLDVELDFSVNINPCADLLFRREGLPDSLASFAGYEDDFARLSDAGRAGLLHADRYPDPYCRKLRQALAVLEGQPAEHLVCGNGASELFMAIAHAVSPKKALVLSPCYSGYEHVLKACGCQIITWQLKEDNGFVPDETILDAINKDLNLFFLAHPNNPTGRLLEKSLLDKIIEKCRQCCVQLVLDACFYPLASGEALSAKDVLIVKAFTKTMAIPGLRLGYLIAEDEQLRNRIEMQLPEWNVSVVAQELGEAAACFLAQSDFMAQSLRYVADERVFLSEQLTKLGYSVFPSDVNYLLLKADAELYGRLLAEKILVRDCTSFESLGPDYVRIAVRTREENQRLISAVGKIQRK